jgi:hypothetical protein
MKAKRWMFTAVPALVGLTAGLVILLAADDPHIIGEALFASGLSTYALSLVKKWITDTTFEKERLRNSILSAEEAATQAQVGRALQLADRERDRRLAEEVRTDAERRIQAERERADQAEINAAMRAHAFEQQCEERYERKLADGIGSAEARASAEIAAIRRETEDERAKLMIKQFTDGVLAERNGEVDDMLAAMKDPKLIRLDDHRPPVADTGNAGTGRG